MIFDALMTACFNDFGLLLLIIFIVFVVVMAKFKVPLVASVLIGFVLLVSLSSLVAGLFLPLLTLIILGGGIALAFVFFKLGRA